jgi:outer membrane protein assembly factor BamD
MKKKLAIALLLSLFLAAACSTKKKAMIDPSDKGSEKTMYENAIKYISKNPEKARLLFKEIMQIYPDSPYASKSKLGIADSYFKTNDPASLLMAAAEYQEYVSLFPYSPEAVYAKYQVGMCYFKQMKKPERDQANTLSAIKAFEGLLQLYPDTVEAAAAKKKIDQCRQNLALHYFKIGYYNYWLQTYLGAIARFKQVMEEYPDFSKNDKLFFFTGKAYLALNDLDSAQSFFQRLVGSYPKSKYARRAQRLIVQIVRLQKTRKAALPATGQEQGRTE